MVNRKNENAKRVARWLFLVAVVVSTLIVQHVPVSATFAGANGRIVYSNNSDGDYEIYSMKSDGTDIIKLTDNTVNDTRPRWSPDGTHIVFRRVVSGLGDIFIMKSDGSDVINVTNSTVDEDAATYSPEGTKVAFARLNSGVWNIFSRDITSGIESQITNLPGVNSIPSWSPDGSTIAFRCAPGGVTHICTINVDGTGLVDITNDSGTYSDPYWSPDGSKLTFHSVTPNFAIWTANPDGSAKTQVINGLTRSLYPHFSPDGTKMVFLGTNPVNNLYTMNVDGSNTQQLTNVSGVIVTTPDWQPLKPPILATDTATTSTGSAVVINVLANDKDLYGTVDAATLTIQSVTNGSAVLDANRNILFTPQAGFNGAAQVTYSVCSASTGLCNTAVLGISVKTLAASQPGTTLSNTGFDVNTLQMTSLIITLGGLICVGMRKVIISRR